MDATISRCPICGGKASAVHLVADGLDFGWMCGCDRYAVSDGIHGITADNMHTEQSEAMRPMVDGHFRASVIRKWNEKAEKIMELMKDNG